jgi:multidrug efflux system membrane fusion protein
MGNPEQALRAGISARLKVKTTAILAHLIPASSILLNDIGETVVRVLDQKQIVDSLKVTAVGESAQGIWVAGLPEKVVLVTVGQNYIIDGEHVDPSFPAASPKQ